MFSTTGFSPQVSHHKFLATVMLHHKPPAYRHRRLQHGCIHLHNDNSYHPYFIHVLYHYYRHQLYNGATYPRRDCSVLAHLCFVFSKDGDASYSSLVILTTTKRFNNFFSSFSFHRTSVAVSLISSLPCLSVRAI